MKVWEALVQSQVTMQQRSTTTQNAAKHWYNEDVTGRTATRVEKMNVYIYIYTLLPDGSNR